MEKIKKLNNILFSKTTKHYICCTLRLNQTVLTLNLQPDDLYIDGEMFKVDSDKVELEYDIKNAKISESTNEFDGEYELTFSKSENEQLNVLVF